jgi:uncharacterized caspase-like protein
MKSLITLLLFALIGFSATSTRAGAGFNLEVSPLDAGVGNQVALTVTRTQTAELCAVEFHFGDGNSRKRRLEPGSASITERYTYAKPGSYKVVAAGATQFRGLNVATACEGEDRSLTHTVGGGNTLSVSAASATGKADVKQTLHLPSVASTSGEKRVALVIGNNAYRSIPPLAKATNDARALGRALEQAGFQIRSVIDGNRTQMNMAINQFVEDISGGGIGVFFFAGHGVQVNNQNFLIPTDLPPIAREADIADHGISLQILQDKIAEARAKFSLLVIDACRDNPLPKKAGRSIGATRGLTQASSAEGQMVVFSAGANQQALDSLNSSDQDPNGVFTREFLPWVSKPGVSVRDAVLNVRSAVRAKAKTVDHDQFPAIYDQAEGNFYFVFQGPTTGQVQPAAQADPEAEAWGIAQRANTESGYRSYLDVYPNGRFAPAAKVALGALTIPLSVSASSKPTPPIDSQPPTSQSKRNVNAASDPETEFWNEVKVKGSVEYFDAYLKQYPKGKFATLAAVEQKKIKDKEKADKAREEVERKLAVQRQNQDRTKAEKEVW